MKQLFYAAAIILLMIIAFRVMKKVKDPEKEEIFEVPEDETEEEIEEDLEDEKGV